MTRQHWNRRVAAVDCGTNSLRLLVADVDPASGALVDVDRRTEIVRLGEGVDRTGRLSDEALERTFAVARFYAAIAAEAGVRAVGVVATSASRDASNASGSPPGCTEIFRCRPQVITGDEEAALAFAGAARALPEHRERGPVLVVDVGGGSTEVVLGDDRRRGRPVGRRRIGAAHRAVPAVRPAHRRGDRARPGGGRRGTDVVAGAVPLDKATLLVGVAGTVTTVTAHALGLPAYDSGRRRRGAPLRQCARPAPTCWDAPSRSVRSCRTSRPAGWT